MKTFILAIIAYLVTGTTSAQIHEYAQIHIVKVGINTKANIVYDFGSDGADSVSVYENHAIKNFVDALEFMECKGWELLSINEYSVGSTVAATTTANFRRKKTHQVVRQNLPIEESSFEKRLRDREH